VYRQRFGLVSHVLPQDAQGSTFFETPTYKKLARRFKMLADSPAVGLLTSEAGVGKTASMRNLCASLPRPDYQVLYICDTAVSPLDFYRQLAVMLGVHPSHRRAILWQNIKGHLVQLVDEHNVRPVLIVDECQHLCDRFLLDLSGFLNFAMDSRNLLTLWLVGQPSIRPQLRMQKHSALATRIVASIHLEPLTDRELFVAFVQHGLQAAGAESTILSDSALELLFRASRGIPRRLSMLLREALLVAHEQQKSFVDDVVMDVVLDEEEL
jgi:type II secretory pathway predicted ATPase ExeA